MRWLVQKNLGSVRDLERLRQACHDLELSFEWVDSVPFSTEPPAVDKSDPLNGQVPVFTINLWRGSA